jgi:hypothetical protein
MLLDNKQQSVVWWWEELAAEEDETPHSHFSEHFGAPLCFCPLEAIKPLHQKKNQIFENCSKCACFYEFVLI